MNHIFSKLRSRSGSSMLIALMFMLICVFVGGSVLVAATVNSGRLAGKRQEQQDMLNQRSIISVISGELVGANNKLDLKLEIGKDAAEFPMLVIPTDVEGIKQLIFQCAYDTFSSGRKSEKSFQIAYTDDSGRSAEVSCYISCTVNYDVYIGFEDNPQLKLKLKASKTDKYLTWYDGQVVKDGEEE